MDLIRTTDHIQSLAGFSSQNPAPRDLSKPITNLSEFKGSALPRGRANAGHALDQYAPNILQATDTPPPSLIARLAKGVIATQRRRLASLPSSSQDRRIAEHYKASFVLEDRGGATAPGATLSLRPTGKAAGGMDNLANRTRAELRELQLLHRRDMTMARQEFNRHMYLAEQAETARERQIHENYANTQRQIELSAQADYDAICWELEARSGRSHGGPGF